MPKNVSKRPTAAYTPESKSKKVQPLPRWYAPAFITIGVVGLVYVVVTYLMEAAGPIPGIGQWNLLVGFGIMMVGFAMALRWR